MRRVMTIGVAIIALAFAGSSPAAAEGDGECRQFWNGVLIAASEEGTMGDYRSDRLYGNEPNMADGSLGGPSEQEPGSQAGNVVATWSPGPFVNRGYNEPPRNDRTRGAGSEDVQAFIKGQCN